MSQRILALQLKRIGDFILTIPALAALRQTLPDAELVVVAPQAVYDLASGLPWLNRVIPFATKGINADAWLTSVAGSWDGCLDFTGNDRSALMTFLSRATSRVGYEKFATKGVRKWAYQHLSAASLRNLHTIDFHKELVQTYLGKSLDELPAVKFEFGEDANTALQQKLYAAGLKPDQPYAILHPGTARIEKFWLDERWAQVATHVNDQLNLQVVLTGTGTGLEEIPLQKIKQSLKVPVIDLCGQLSLAEMAMVVEKTTVIAGVDSMAMHLAALAQRPQVALFGPTNPFHWRARHPKAVTLQGADGSPITSFSPKCDRVDMNQISTAAVIDAISAVL